MKGTIDRFEDEVAVLIVEGGQRAVPRSSLPAGAREGDVVDLSRGEIDRAATEQLRSRVRSAREGAFKGKKLPPGQL